jgi:hypothetical protein
MQKPLYKLSGASYTSPTITVSCRTLVKMYVLGAIWPVSELLIASCSDTTKLREKLTRYLRDPAI